VPIKCTKSVPDVLRTGVLLQRQYIKNDGYYTLNVNQNVKLNQLIYEKKHCFLQESAGYRFVDVTRFVIDNELFFEYG
jgi:hypothetical protein